MPPPAPVRLLLVDDHPSFSQGLSLLLHAAAGDRLRVAGSVREAAEAADVAAALRVDLAVVDLVMPPPGGLAAVRALRDRLPGLPVVVLSGHDDPAAPLEALGAGAVGFLPKAADPAELVAPLLAAAQGWTVLPAAARQALLDDDQSRAARLRDALTDDERELWRLVALGHGPEQLAGLLYVSERTAKRLVVALLARLGVDNRVHAAALAGRAGLVG